MRIGSLIVITTAMIGCSAPDCALPDDCADGGHVEPPETDAGQVARDAGSPATDAGATPSDAATLDETYRCTLVIGYSQVGLRRGGWYSAGGAFESMVEDARWQLLWNGGGGVDQWLRSDYEGWSNPVESPCAVGSDEPDRVLLSVSGDFGADEDAWVTAIEGALTEIRARYPSVRRIVLQPVVGGPMHAGCMIGAELVRASWQHAHIDAAISRVVGGDVEAGMSPEVRACDDYVDATGHLRPAAAEAIGRTIGEHYR